MFSCNGCIIITKSFKYPANQIPVVPGLLTVISWVIDSVQVVVYPCKRSQTYKYSDKGSQINKDSGERSVAYKDYEKIKIKQESTAVVNFNCLCSFHLGTGCASLCQKSSFSAFCVK